MDLSGLSLDQAPPYHVVARFFITAPVFLFFTGLVMLFLPGFPFYSIINTQLIGITHMVTLGFITMTMFGAFFQMLPVVAGVKIKNPKAVSSFTYFTFLPGVILYVLAYLFSLTFLYPYTAFLLASAVIIFISNIILKLFKVKPVSDTIRAMRLSLISLFILMIIGVLMILWRGEIIKGLNLNLLPVHIGWGFFGWVLILIMGVSFQVVPMFYVAPSYPVFFRKVNPVLIFSVLSAYTVFSLSGTAGLSLKILKILVYAMAGSYGIATLMVLSKRKRKLPDPSLLFWKTGMSLLILAMITATANEFYSGQWQSKVIILTGLMFLVGFVVSIIIGMMYKIIPFLSWFHLASKGIFSAPTMKDMLPDFIVKGHYATYLVFLFFLPALSFWPIAMKKVTGGFLAFSALMLWWNLFIVMRRYGIIKKNNIQTTTLK